MYLTMKTKVAIPSDITLKKDGDDVIVSFLSAEAIAAAKDRIAFEPCLYVEDNVLKMKVADTTDVSFLAWAIRQDLTYSIEGGGYFQI